MKKIIVAVSVVCVVVEPRKCFGLFHLGIFCTQTMQYRRGFREPVGTITAGTFPGGPGGLSNADIYNYLAQPSAATPYVRF